MTEAFLYPVLALAVLTLIVTVVMYSRRIRYMTSEQIHPQKVQDRAAIAAHLPDTRASDNYMNLFEAPILFYVASFTIILSHSQSSVLLWLSWVFVALRVGHSFIHCTYNTVYHRFYCFILSIICLIAIWVLLGMKLVFGISV